MPPAPWHIGTPPTLALKMFIRPVEVEILLSLTATEINAEHDRSRDELRTNWGAAGRSSGRAPKISSGNHRAA